MSDQYSLQGDICCAKGDTSWMWKGRVRHLKPRLRRERAIERGRREHVRHAQQQHKAQLRGSAAGDDLLETVRKNFIERQIMLCFSIFEKAAACPASHCALQACTQGCKSCVAKSAVQNNLQASCESFCTCMIGCTEASFVLCKWHCVQRPL